MITYDYNKKTRKMQVIADDTEELAFEELRAHFSVANEGAVFARRAGARFVPDRKYVITPTGTCAPGLHGAITDFLVAYGGIMIKHTEAFQEYLHVGKEWEPYNDFEEPYDLRYYQEEFLQAAFKAGRGVCIMGTGGGKTLTCASLIQTYANFHPAPHFKCLIIVPDVGLVNQTYNDFSEYGVKFKFTKWTGANVPDMSADVIICNSTILVRRFDTPECAWIKHVDLLVVDEVHAISNTNKISDVVGKIITTHKYGFTGTLPKEKLAQWGVIGNIGPVLFEKTSADLRAEDYLTNVEVKRVEINYLNKVPRKKKKHYHDELDFIRENKFRNNLLKTVCDGYPKNILILVNNIDHGLKLYDVLSDLSRPVYFIRGEVEVEERQRVIAEMEANDDIIVIAISKIFSTGINVKNLHMLIFAAGGKSFIRTVQAIGRGLRKHVSKTIFNIIDICDILKYGEEHAEVRASTYDKERIKHKTIILTEKV